MPRPEEEWMRRFQQGDERAYLLLFERFHRPLFRTLCGILGRSDLAEETTQEVLLTLYERRDDYREGSVAAWLFTIARNRGLRLRERRSRERLAAEPGRGLAAASPGPESRLLRSEEVERVRRGLASLPEGQREILCLREYGGFSYAEIAEATGRSHGAVRNELHRSRKALRTILTEKEREKTR